MIHTTIGIYPSGNYKVNGVSSENLQDHIEYNKKFRFGRALVVDGEIIYEGLGCKAAIKELEEVIKNTKITKDTAPYH